MLCDMGAVVASIITLLCGLDSEATLIFTHLLFMKQYVAMHNITTTMTTVDQVHNTSITSIIVPITYLSSIEGMAP